MSAVVDAVELARAQAFDVVLMDISLPGIDGVEAARRIRGLGRPHGGDLPIIAVSAHVFRNEIEHVLDAGMDAFIGKPVSPERIRDVLAEVLSRQTRNTDPADGRNPEALRHSVFDRGVLDRDLGVLGPERTGRIVAAFFDDAADKVRELERAIENGDWQAAANAAHGLKGSAGNLGLQALEHAAQELEAAANRRECDETERKLAGLLGLFDASSSALRNYWRTRGTPAADQSSMTSSANM